MLGLWRNEPSPRFELLNYANDPDIPFRMLRTGRYGFVLNILRDGEADVDMDDGKPPYIVKWRQIRYLPEDSDEDCSGFKA